MSHHFAIRAGIKSLLRRNEKSSEHQTVDPHRNETKITLKLTLKLWSWFSVVEVSSSHHERREREREYVYEMKKKNEVLKTLYRAEYIYFSRFFFAFSLPFACVCSPVSIFSSNLSCAASLSSQPVRSAETQTHVELSARCEAEEWICWYIVDDTQEQHNPSWNCEEERDTQKIEKKFLKIRAESSAWAVWEEKLEECLEIL